MVYKFRVILDAEEDIFRDIAILENDTLEDLHNAIVNAFGFDGLEVASFTLVMTLGIRKKKSQCLMPAISPENRKQ